MNDMDATIEMIDTSEITEVVITLLDLFFVAEFVRASS